MIILREIKLTNQEYLDELEKNRVEMVPKGKIEDSIIIPEQRNVLDFCLKDKGFKEAYEKSGNKDSFEDTLKNFIEYLFENKNNPRSSDILVVKEGIKKKGAEKRKKNELDNGLVTIVC